MPLLLGKIIRAKLALSWRAMPKETAPARGATEAVLGLDMPMGTGTLP